MLWRGEETPSPRHGDQRADVPRVPGPQAPHWSPPVPALQPPVQSYGGRYPGAGGPYGEAPWAIYPPQQESYRFRPLDERERRRIEEQAQSSYGSPAPRPSARDSWPAPQHPPAGTAPPTYGVDPAVRDPWLPDWGGRGWGTEAYGYRQPDSASPGGDRWQGPYSRPVYPGNRPPPDPGPYREPSQWGAIPPERTPPSYRMYPSRESPRDRRLATR